MRPRHGLLFKLALLCGLLLPLVAWLAALLLITDAPLDTADRIVVLAGSSSYQERVWEAAKLLREGRSNRILITNDDRRGPWSQEEQRNPFFYERSLEELKNAGVPADSIEVLKQPVSSTQDEAVVVKAYAQGHGLRSILVVTSPYHSRRALWIFNHEFAGTDTRVGLVHVDLDASPPPPATWWLSVRGWRLVPSEYAKMLLYLINYNEIW